MDKQQILQALPQVEEASIDMIMIQHLYTLLQFLTSLLTGLNILLAMAVILIIGNTLRLILRDRQHEMMVYQLIGASDAHIMRPYLYSGIGYGLIAASLACMVVNVFIYFLNQKLTFFSDSYHWYAKISSISMDQISLILLGSGFLGWLGARLSARRICQTSF